MINLNQSVHIVKNDILSTRVAIWAQYQDFSSCLQSIVDIHCMGGRLPKARIIARCVKISFRIFIFTKSGAAHLDNVL